MARLEFFVVSRSVSIDQSTNMASILEVLEEVHASAFPIALHCVATSLWRQESGDEIKDYQLNLRITTPDGGTYELPTNFRLDAARHRVLQRVEGVPIKQAGKLRFEAVLNGEHSAEHIIDILQDAQAKSES